MKSFLCALTITMAILTPAVAQQSSSDHLIAPGQGIGPIQIGMSFDDVKGMLGQPSTSRPLSTESVILQPGKSMLHSWRSGPGNGLSVQTTTANEIYIIGTFVANYRIAEGIHVGSRLSEVTSLLGAPSRTVSRPSISADYVIYDDRGIEFVVGADSMKGNFRTVTDIFVFKSVGH